MKYEMKSTHFYTHVNREQTCVIFFFFLKKKIGKKEKSFPIYLVVVPNPILKNACVV